MKKIFMLFAAVVCGLAVNAKTIYLNTGGSALWGKDNPVFFVHAWASPEANEDVQMSQVSGDIYSADINDAYNNIIFLREATGSTSVIWEGDGLWNKTGDLEIPSDKDMYTITGWGQSDGSWSVYGDEPGPGPQPQPSDAYDYYLMGNIDGTGAGDITTPTDNELFECGKLTYSFPGNELDGGRGYFFVMRCDAGSKVGTGYMGTADMRDVTNATLLSQATHQGLFGKMAIVGPEVTFYLYYGNSDDELILSTEELEGKTLVGNCGGTDPGTEAVENTVVKTNARKAMIDGRLVIIRGEQMFDATGRAL